MSSTHVHQRCDLEPDTCCTCWRKLCSGRDALTGTRCVLEADHPKPYSNGEVWDHVGPFPLAWRTVGNPVGPPTTEPRFWTMPPEDGVDGHPTNLGPGWVGIVDELAGGVVAWTHEDRADHVIAGLLAAT